MKLTPEEKAGVLKQQVGHPGLHTFAACPACGNLTFRSTETAKPEDVVVHEDGSVQCARCQEAFMRGPEIVKWVMAVIGYQKRKAEDHDTP
jgi:hypothetical protein